MSSLLGDTVQPGRPSCSGHFGIYPRAWVSSLCHRAPVLPPAPSALPTWPPPTWHPSPQAPAAPAVSHSAGAAGNFLCPAGALSFNAFKTVMDIDTSGTFNVSRVLYEKFFRVGVLPAGASPDGRPLPAPGLPLTAARSLPWALCVAGPWRGDREHHCHPGEPGAGAPGACRLRQGRCGYDHPPRPGLPTWVPSGPSASIPGGQQSPREAEPSCRQRDLALAPRPRRGQSGPFISNFLLCRRDDAALGCGVGSPKHPRQQPRPRPHQWHGGAPATG